jgi:hypothetical protein
LKYLELATTKTALTREPWLLLENLFKIVWGCVFKSSEISHLGDRKKWACKLSKGDQTFKNAFSHLISTTQIGFVII